MRYEQMDVWTRIADLITNRASLINQLLGAKYDNALDNPLLISCERGRYVCKLCGEPYCTWKVYDLDSTERAFDRLDALLDGLWLIGRTGIES